MWEVLLERHHRIYVLASDVTYDEALALAYAYRPASSYRRGERGSLHSAYWRGQGKIVVQHATAEY